MDGDMSKLAIRLIPNWWWHHVLLVTILQLLQKLCGYKVKYWYRVYTHMMTLSELSKILNSQVIEWLITSFGHGNLVVKI